MLKATVKFLTFAKAKNLQFQRIHLTHYANALNAKSNAIKQFVSKLTNYQTSMHSNQHIWFELSCVWSCKVTHLEKWSTYLCGCSRIQFCKTVLNCFLLIEHKGFVPNAIITQITLHQYITEYYCLLTSKHHLFIFITLFSSDEKFCKCNAQSMFHTNRSVPNIFCFFFLKKKTE